MNAGGMMDREKLTKLMNLTFSDNDHEALSALRKAMLREEKRMWNFFLLASGSPAPKAPEFKGEPGFKYRWDAAHTDEGGRTPPPKSKEEIDITIRGFEQMIAKLDGKKRLFVEGCLDFYKTRGYLTGKQARVIQGILNGMDYEL
jgi:hypothetical protein